MAVAVVAVLVGVAYARAAHRHPRRWAPGRSAACGGAVVAAVASAAVGDATMTRHMVEHLLLGMVVPFLVALAAPATLVLQAGGPATKRLARRALHGPVGRALARPAVGFCLFGGGLVAVYLSPVLEASATDAAVHLVVHAHLVASGTLFLVPIVGTDVLARPVPFAARFVVILAAVPFHAFLAVAILGADAPLAPDAYPDLDDQRRAAGVLWAGGELLAIAAAAVVYRRWWVAEHPRDRHRRATAAAASGTSRSGDASR